MPVSMTGPASASAADVGMPHGAHAGDETEAGADPSHMTERERLVWAMEQCGWVQAKAARLLNLTPRQIGYALSRYNIEVKRL
jgi:Nif-specific regulatory protein